MDSNVLREFDQRGLLAQVSDRGGLEHHISTGVRTAYAGFDPTAPSLHIGNLVPLMALRRFQRSGHCPIALVGGATGLVGDPSGREDERQLNDADQVSQWVDRLRSQVSRFISFDGENPARVVDNLEWTRELDAISFLRDIGKHFSVNAMLQRDSVKARLEQDNQGISYTEFSYMLLQALDFVELNRRYGCTIQFGGSDQWGNMVSGVDLVRRMNQVETFVMTLPLITKKDGTKFGKTAGGSVWLDGELTSPYSFYQFWMNVADEDVGRFIRCFTDCGEAECTAIESESQAHPSRRIGQGFLASQVTQLVHGESSLESARRITKALFDGAIEELTESDFEQLALDGLTTATVTGEASVSDVVVDLGFAPSRSRARSLISGGGVWLDGVSVGSHEAKLDSDRAWFGKYHLLRRGRKTWGLVLRK